VYIVTRYFVGQISMALDEIQLINFLLSKSQLNIQLTTVDHWKLRWRCKLIFSTADVHFRSILYYVYMQYACNLIAVNYLWTEPCRYSNPPCRYPVVLKSKVRSVDKGLNETKIIPPQGCYSWTVQVVYWILRVTRTRAIKPEDRLHAFGVFHGLFILCIIHCIYGETVLLAFMFNLIIFSIF